MTDVVLERGWIADSDLLWLAVITVPGHGRVSAADETPWRAITRAWAHVVLRQHGLDTPSLAREELSTLVARARAAQAVEESLAQPRLAQRRRRKAS
jgi:hypothetical protein